MLDSDYCYSLTFLSLYYLQHLGISITCTCIITIVTNGIIAPPNNSNIFSAVAIISILVHVIHFINN